MLKKSSCQSNRLNEDKIQKALVKLYLSMKEKIKRKSLIPTVSEEIEINHHNLYSLDSLQLINYIKESIDIIIQMEINDKIDQYKSQKENTQEEYEAILIKYESDIRSHIKVEHQLKLYADNLQEEIDLYQKENNELISKLSKFKKNYQNNNYISIYEKDNQILKKENNALTQKFNVIAENEKKLKGEIKKLNNEIIILTEKYQKLKKILNSYEEKSNLNTSNPLISTKTTRKSSNAYLHKRVINTNTRLNQLTKRNKPSEGTFLINNTVNNRYNSSVDSKSRSMSKNNQDGLIKKIESKIKTSSSAKKKNHYCNRSVGNIKSGKDYDKIKLIKDLLIKKEPSSNNKSQNHLKIPSPNSTYYNKCISINKNRIINHCNSLNNSNNTTMIIQHIHNLKNKKNKKVNNRKFSSSLIINQPNNSFVNNINIFTTSPKNNNN